MPDYYTYEYDRLVDGEIKIDNPERTVEVDNEHKAVVDAVTDENAKQLFNILFPATTVQKSLSDELIESETFGSIIHDISMSGAVCSVRMTRELTEAEITELDNLVETHKTNG